MLEVSDLDAFISTTYPLVPAPTHQELVAHDVNGIRYLVAANGLWRELQWPWLHATYPLLTDKSVSLPYGALHEQVHFKCPAPQPALWTAFIKDAKAAMPHEAAGALIWNALTSEWRYEKRQTLSARGDFIQYAEVQLGEDEHLVVDIHSHGVHKPFFSSIDDQDDKGSVKVSVVVGSLHANPSWVMRLNLLDRKVAMSLDADFNFKVEPFNDSCDSRKTA